MTESGNAGEGTTSLPNAALPNTALRNTALKNTVRWDRDGDGVITLTLDDPAQRANTMNEAYRASMHDAVARLTAERDTITGVIIASAKKTFFAGGDLNELITAGPGDAERVFALAQAIKAPLRTLETLGRPVVAAINGAALGGGLEIALAAHHRIAADTPGTVLGLPEVTLGLLPGGGGIVRTVRRLGVADALEKVLLHGRRLTPRQALEAGLVDELTDTVEGLIPAAKAWIAAHPDAAQPYDAPGWKIPGGTPATPAFAAVLPSLPARLRKELKGANYPAPRAILAAAVESTQVDLDTALEVESRYFTQVATGQVSTNMTQAFFFDMAHIRAGGSRPQGVARHTASKVAVLGAGMMGAGIAYVCARAGMDVVLKDVTLEAAERGKGHSRGLVAKAVERGTSSEADAGALLARITPTDAAADVAGADLVIEAVFEDMDVKARAFAEVGGLVADGAVLATNTSTLPITALAAGVRDRERFVGLHFFSPVEKMPLLEIITGAETSAETLARAFDIAVQLGKTPIVVNDSRGFFTSRVIGTFINEALAMVGEGISPVAVEQAGSQAGYQSPPLQLADELNLTLLRKIARETKEGLERDGGVQTYRHHPGTDVLERMVEEFGRTGRLGGAGFYDYADGRRTCLWKGLAGAFGGAAGIPDGSPPHTEVPFPDMMERMLFAEALETARCLEEGVLCSIEDANVGSILGIGFPGWTGGVVQYMNQYDGGLPGFVARSRELAARYGERFTPPASLLAKAAAGERY